LNSRQNTAILVCKANIVIYFARTIILSFLNPIGNDSFLMCWDEKYWTDSFKIMRISSVPRAHQKKTKIKMTIVGWSFQDDFKRWSKKSTCLHLESRILQSFRQVCPANSQRIINVLWNHHRSYYSNFFVVFNHFNVEQNKNVFIDQLNRFGSWIKIVHCFETK